MFVVEPGYIDQLSRWGLDHLAGALAFPAQIGPPPNIPQWQRVAGGNNDACYRLTAAADDPQWRFHTLYLKQWRFNPPSWRYLFRASRAQHEAANLQRLAALGVHCPRVVAMGEERQAASLLTRIGFSLAAAAATTGLAVLLLGAFMVWLAGWKVGGETLRIGTLATSVSLALIAAGASFVGLLRWSRRDYLVGSAMILTAIEPSEDLWRFAMSRWQRPFRGDPIQHQQVLRLSRQLAGQLAFVHRNRFVHADLKFRNLLACWTRGQAPGTDNLRLAWIDCPRGRRVWPGRKLTRAMLGDLASLDRNASLFLSRSQRLRFLHDYLLAFGGERSVRRTRDIVRSVLRRGKPRKA